MRQIYNIIISVFLILLMFSCYEDKSNKDLTRLDKFEIDGVLEKYKLIAFSDTLRIAPVVTSEQNKEYDYLWGYFKINASGDDRKIDTISFEKNLEYPINLSPAAYKLVFIATEKETGISHFKHADLSVETVTSRGWYILKDKDGYTDMDLHNDYGVKTNLINRVNGRSLKGNVVQLGFASDYQYIDPYTKTKKEKERCLIPLSEDDMSVLRVADIKEINNFDGLLYSNSEQCKPTFWVSSSSCLFFGNNGKIFSLSTRSSNVGKFGYPKNHEYDYKLSNHFIESYSYLCPTVFDEVKSSFYTVTESGLNLVSYTEEGRVDSLKYYPTRNLNSDLLYMSHQNGGHNYYGTGLALLKKRSSADTLLLAHLEMYSNDPYSGRVNPLNKIDTIPSGLNIYNAEMYANNRDFGLLYFVVDNSISYYDIRSKEEKGVYSFPDNEEITYMRHLKFNDWRDDIFEKFVVSTYSNGKYKVYLFDMLAGGLKENPEIMEGEGRVGDVIYINPYSDNSNIKY